MSEPLSYGALKNEAKAALAPGPTGRRFRAALAYFAAAAPENELIKLAGTLYHDAPAPPVIVRGPSSPHKQVRMPRKIGAPR